MFAIPPLFEWAGPDALSEMTLRFFWKNTLRPLYELMELDEGRLHSAAVRVLALQIESADQRIRIGALEGLLAIDSRESHTIVDRAWERLSQTERSYTGKWPRVPSEWSTGRQLDNS
jgi:hypothetical protein